LANYQYVSKESKLNFRYKNIERQIIERYVQTKQLVNLKTIQLFEYSEEMSNLAILKRLKTSIKQCMLEDYAQKSIYDDFKNINEASEALHLLKTVINFAVSTSANQDMKLSEFIRTIYINNSYKSADRVLKINTIETCQLKHLTHLWIILMMKRAILFSLKDQEPFEFLDDTFKKPFDDTEPNIILNPQNSISYALVIYQLIVFFVSDLMKQDEYQLACSYDIKDTLSNMDEEILQANEIANDLDSFFPSGVKLENIYGLWKSVVIKLSKF
jgi:E3 ubiquitin-protein ligase RNF213